MNATRFYIDGKWIDAAEHETLPVIDPATEQSLGLVALGTTEDVDRAVAAARRAFPAAAETPIAERAGWLDRCIEAYEERWDALAEAVSHEMGAPISLAREVHVKMGAAHLRQARALLDTFAFETLHGAHRVRREPIGVCALITPWNWPLNQIGCKVAPALAAGCSMVLKPSEIAPLSATLFAEAVDAAGLPPGVFNLVHGTGPVVGQALAAHPDVDMVSFTGSTRAGKQVAHAAADGVKRVAQELGGKSANILLDDADFERAVAWGVERCTSNSGQTCTAPTRMLVPRSRYEEAVDIAARHAAEARVGDPRAAETAVGPLSSEAQFEKVQALIAQGIEEGARVVTGGLGRPDATPTGYFARPTIFADVRNDMTIAREEIFGPVLCILPYADEDDAVAIANDSPYGLSGAVHSADPGRARRVAERLRTGMVLINGAGSDPALPFGGYKQSGNGREWGAAGLEEYLETKTLFGGA